MALFDKDKFDLMISDLRSAVPRDEDGTPTERETVPGAWNPNFFDSFLLDFGRLFGDEKEEEEEKDEKDEEEEKIIMEDGDHSAGLSEDGYGIGGSVDPTGADHIGAGGLMDFVDSLTGGALSGMHNAGVDEIGGLAATGKGASGWGTGSYGNVGSSYSGGFDGGDMASGAGSVDATGGFGVGDDPSGGGWDPGDGYGDGDTGGSDGDDDGGGFDGGLGYREGGYTGDNWGTVHPNEYVASTEMLQENPGLVEFLDALRMKAIRD